ncbi:PRC-barrel domain-containing protein [Dyadobacter pollutisoli]|uniref:PRC-barrel domain-containing protein n=1 Tax=Dyadobacter pollutisoli TaxID=2910158 RepID=A0A9E8SPP9_9BACT|nr:PRC-barrel domain-containing protein [Dyadobacter pollutisoli]WAC14956.1 PRC-barrel domain-containing protein [Dyadobacter pollutisoli]
MKRSLKSFTGFSLGATDGEIGKVEELYFDDDTWTVRYLVVKTGGWLSGRKVLIATQAILAPIWEDEIFQTNLSLDQIRESPDIDTDKPVSRQEESKLYSHFPWHIYWGPGTGSMGGLMPLSESVKAALAEERKNKGLLPDEHLRSTEKVKGYHIHATDGELGHVVDYIVDTENWEIGFLVVETGSWFSHNKILVSPTWISEINWSTARVIVNVTVDTVKSGPPYDPNNPVNEVYETNLRDYYGRLVR